MKRLILGGLLALLPLTHALAVTVGETPPTVVLNGADGGRVSGEAWSSAELTGKVHVLFYVDPDEKSLNDHVSAALKQAAFPAETFGSVAAINMKATWLPNSLIESSLQEKQKEFPDTVYLKDFKKVLVQRWGIADHNNDVLLFAPDGRLVFYKAGKLSDSDIRLLLDTIKTHLPSS